MFFRLLFLLILFQLKISVALTAQERPLPKTKEPVKKEAIDSLQLTRGDLLNRSRTATLDTIPPSLPNSRPQAPPETVKIDKDALDEKIDYSAADSQRLDIKNEVVYLYGNAKVIYGQRTLTADYIVFNLKDNIATAEGLPDSSGVMAGFPKFEDGDQVFDAKKLKYNFKSGKGIIYDARTKQDDLYIVGNRTKYISAENQKTKKDDAVYSKNALITTCNHPNPHFGIRAKKIKVVPDKVAVVGPSNLEIAGVGTPIVLPFGFFPLKDYKSTGLVRGDFERSNSLGLGLRGWGWYFPFNDYMDLTMRGDIYTRGTFRIYGDFNYKKRYKYTGGLDVTITSNNLEDTLVYRRNNSFSIRWTHRQDSKAHPSRTFGGNLNFQTNNNQANTFTDANSRLNNVITSNMNYSNSLLGSPFTFTAGLSHSQNNRSREITIDFPTANLTMQQIYPFKKKIPGSKEKWFEKIGIRYSAEMKNRVEATDTTFFTQTTLDNLQTGLKHRGEANATFNLLKYINVTPSASVTEVWNLKYLDKTFDPTPVVTVDSIKLNPDEPAVAVYDTTAYGSVVEELKTGLKAYHLFETSVRATTKVFGTMLFKKGWLRGIRHQMSPSVSFRYTPSYASGFLNYFREVDTDSRDEFNDPEQYGVFERSVYTPRPNANGEQRSIDFNLGNVVETKYFSKKDSTEKKFKLINTLNISTSYNMAKDTQQWDPLRFSGNTQFFKNMTRLTFNMQLDPYALDADGTRSNDFYAKENGKILRFVNAGFGLSTRIPIKTIRELISGKKQGGNSNRNQSGNGNQNRNQNQNAGRGNNNQPNSIWEWLESFTISHEFRANINRLSTGRDTFLVTTHSIRTSGSIQLTNKWRLSFGNIAYDIKNKSFTYPTLSFSRDLHCWELGMSWQPEIGTYSFSLRVKPGTLGFISVPWGRNQFDTGAAFR